MEKYFCMLLGSLKVENPLYVYVYVCVNEQMRACWVWELENEQTHCAAVSSINSEFMLSSR